MKPSTCIQCQKPLEGETDQKSGVCTTCYETLVLPAYRHVESVPPDDAVRIMWHGYAVRNAFIAGALHAKKLVMQQLQSLADTFNFEANKLDIEAEKARLDNAPIYQVECITKASIFREASYKAIQELASVS